MAKKVVSHVALHKKKLKPIKHGNKGKKMKSVLTKIFNYMKSDSYMFAPLASHTSLPASFPSDEVRFEPLKKKEKKLVEDVKEYLKCDCYMYAPLLVDSAFHTPILHFESGRVSDDEMAQTREERRKQDDSYNPMKQNIRQLRESMKHILGENSHISSVPGKVVLSQKLEHRKVVVE